MITLLFGFCCFSLVFLKTFVIGIDIGAKNTRTSINDGYYNFHILRSESEKSFIPSIVTFNDTMRYCGEQAFQKYSHFSNQSFPNFINDLGKQAFPNTYRFPLQKAKLELNKTVDRFTVPNLEHSTPEEIIASFLAFINTYASESIVNKIDEFVVTVPPAFTQSQRQAIYAGAKLANLRIRTLLETNVARAIWFGIKNNETMPEKPEIVVNEELTKEDLIKKEKKEKSEKFLAEMLSEDNPPETSTQSSVFSLKNFISDKFSFLSKKKEEKNKPSSTSDNNKNNNNNKWSKAVSSSTSSSSLNSSCPPGSTHGCKGRHYGISLLGRSERQINMLRQIPEEVKRVIFVDVGAYQTTFTLVEYSFPREKKKIRVSSNKEEGKKDITDTDSSSSNNIKNAYIRKGPANVNIILTKSIEMLGGFRFDEPLLLNTTQRLCKMIKEKEEKEEKERVQGDFNETLNETEDARKKKEEEKEEEEEVEICIDDTPTLQRKFPLNDKGERMSKLSGVVDLNKGGGVRMDDFNAEEPLLSFSERQLSNVIKIKEKEKEEKKNGKCRKVKKVKKFGGRGGEGGRYDGVICPALLNNSATLVRLRKEVQKVKETLSIQQQSNLLLEWPVKGIEEFSLIFNRSDYEKDISVLLQHISTNAKWFANDAKAILPPGAMDDIQIEISGGGVKSPYVRKAIAEGLGRKEEELKHSFNFDEEISTAALGAASMGIIVDEREEREVDMMIKKKKEVSNVMEGKKEKEELAKEATESEAVKIKNNERRKLKKKIDLNTTDIIIGENERAGPVIFNRRSMYDIIALINATWNDEQKEKKKEINKTDIDGKGENNSNNNNIDNDNTNNNSTSLTEEDHSFALEEAVLLFPKQHPYNKLSRISIPVGSSILLHNYSLPYYDKKTREREEQTLPLPSSLSISVSYSDPLFLPTGVPEIIGNIKFDNLRELVKKELETKCGKEVEKEVEKINNARIDVDFAYDKRGIIHPVHAQLSMDFDDERMRCLRRREGEESVNIKEDENEEKKKNKTSSSKLKMDDEREFESFSLSFRTLRNTISTFVKLHRHHDLFTPGQPVQLINGTEIQKIRKEWKEEELCRLAGEYSDILSRFSSSSLQKEENDPMYFPSVPSSSWLSLDSLGVNIKLLAKLGRRCNKIYKNNGNRENLSSSLTKEGKDEDALLSRVSIPLRLPSFTRPIRPFRKDEVISMRSYLEQREEERKEEKESADISSSAEELALRIKLHFKTLSELVEANPDLLSPFSHAPQSNWTDGLDDSWDEIRDVVLKEREIRMREAEEGKSKEDIDSSIPVEPAAVPALFSKDSLTEQQAWCILRVSNDSQRAHLLFEAENCLVAFSRAKSPMKAEDAAEFMDNLLAASGPVFMRAYELNQRWRILRYARKRIIEAECAANELMKEEEGRHAAKEVLKVASEAKEWLEILINVQRNIPLTEQPALTAETITKVIEGMDDAIESVFRETVGNMNDDITGFSKRTFTGKELSNFHKDIKKRINELNKKIDLSKKPSSEL